MSTSTYYYLSGRTTKNFEWISPLLSITFTQRWTSDNCSQIVNLSERNIAGSLIFPDAFGPGVSGFGLQHVAFEIPLPKDMDAPLQATITSPVPFLVHIPAHRGGKAGVFIINPTTSLSNTPDMSFSYGYGSPYENFVTYKVSIMLGLNTPWVVGSLRFTRDKYGPSGFTLSLDPGVSFEALVVIYLAAIAVSKAGAFGEEYNDPQFVSE